MYVNPLIFGVGHEGMIGETPAACLDTDSQGRGT